MEEYGSDRESDNKAYPHTNRTHSESESAKQAHSLKAQRRNKHIALEYKKNGSLYRGFRPSFSRAGGKNLRI